MHHLVISDSDECDSDTPESSNHETQQPDDVASRELSGML